MDWKMTAILNMRLSTVFEKSHKVLKNWMLFLT